MKRKWTVHHETDFLQEVRKLIKTSKWWKTQFLAANTTHLYSPPATTNQPIIQTKLYNYSVGEINTHWGQQINEMHSKCDLNYLKPLLIFPVWNYLAAALVTVMWHNNLHDGGLRNTLEVETVIFLCIIYRQVNMFLTIPLYPFFIHWILKSQVNFNIISYTLKFTGNAGFCNKHTEVQANSSF